MISYELLRCGRNNCKGGAILKIFKIKTFFILNNFNEDIKDIKSTDL